MTQVQHGRRLGILCMRKIDQPKHINILKKQIKMIWRQKIRLGNCYYLQGNMADCHYKKNDFEEALLHYYKALSINPNKIECYYNFGNTYCIKKKFDEALECFERVVKDDPQHQTTFYNYANTFLFYKITKMLLNILKKQLNYNLKMLIGGITQLSCILQNMISKQPSMRLQHKIQTLYLCILIISIKLEITKRLFRRLNKLQPKMRQMMNQIVTQGTYQMLIQQNLIFCCYIFNLISINLLILVQSQLKTVYFLFCHKQISQISQYNQRYQQIQ